MEQNQHERDLMLMKGGRSYSHEDILEEMRQGTMGGWEQIRGLATGLRMFEQAARDNLLVLGKEEEFDELKYEAKPRQRRGEMWRRRGLISGLK